MYKVLALAVFMANLTYFSRSWKPGRGQALYQGLQAGALGCSLSCILALTCAWLVPGPYRLAIFTLGFNLLLTPVLITAGIIWGIGLKPKKSRQQAPKTNTTTAFSEVMTQIAGSSNQAYEEALATKEEE